MKLNRKWILVVAMLLSLTMATTGTLAFLTDRDTVENTFTMGNVDIELKENFPDNPPPIKPGEDVNKDAWIENKGDKSAWVWMTVSVPSTLGEYVTPNWADWSNVEGFAKGYTVAEVQTVEDDQGNETTVWTVLVNDMLAAGAKTPFILDYVTLSELVDYQNGKYVVVENGVPTDLVGLDGNNLNVTVKAYAIQTDSFENVQAAYNAYNVQWGEDGTPLANVREFDDNDIMMAPREGDDVTILDKNKTIDTTDSQIGVDAGKLQLDVAYQFEPTMTKEELQDTKYADWHADFVVSVDKDVPPYGIGLAGYYDAWCSLNKDNWVMLAVDQEIKANEEIRLVADGMNGITLNYSEICEFGNDGIGFLCGAVALNGMTVNGTLVENADVSGTTLTVELRLYEVMDKQNASKVESEQGGEVKTVGTFKYTF